MIVIDSSALIAILRLEADARRLLQVLVSARGRMMSALNLLETSLVLAGPKGEANVWDPLDAFVTEAGIEVIDFDNDQQQHARAAFLSFGKGRHPAALNFGDCAAYALAKSKNLPLLFKGNDFTKTDVLQAHAAAG